MFGDFFQWERFVTPKLIRIIFWIYLIFIAILVVVGIGAGVMAMGRSLLGGLGTIVGSLIGGLIGLIFVRVLCELTMIAFRIEEHLRAVRIRWEA